MTTEQVNKLRDIIFDESYTLQGVWEQVYRFIDLNFVSKEEVEVRMKDILRRYFGHHKTSLELEGIICMVMGKPLPNFIDKQPETEEESEVAKLNDLATQGSPTRGNPSKGKIEKLNYSEEYKDVYIHQLAGKLNEVIGLLNNITHVT